MLFELFKIKPQSCNYTKFALPAPYHLHTLTLKISEGFSKEISFRKMSASLNPTIAAGDGLIHVGVLPPSQLTLHQLNFKYPLKLISPAPSQWAKSLTVFVLSYGGGLVSGDAVNLKVIVESQGKLCLQTQGG